jgi:hypothetical protein
LGKGKVSTNIVILAQNNNKKCLITFLFFYVLISKRVEVTAGILFTESLWKTQSLTPVTGLKCDGSQEGINTYKSDPRTCHRMRNIAATRSSSTNKPILGHLKRKRVVSAIPYQITMGLILVITIISNTENMLQLTIKNENKKSLPY